MFKIGEMLNMLKMLKSFLGLDPPPFPPKKGGGKTQKTFNSFNISPVGSIFVLWVCPLNFNIFNISLVGSTFFKKDPPPK